MSPEEKLPPMMVSGRSFYRIVPNEDGTCDVWLTPGKPVPIMDTLTGIMDFNIRVLAVRGVVYYDGLEEDVRRRYGAWLQSAEEIEI